MTSQEELDQNSSPVTPTDIRMTDTDGIYSVFHYEQCDDSSSSELKATRGVIRLQDGTIVCQTFNYTPEYIGATKENLAAISKKCGRADRKYYIAEEGTLVRVWFHNYSWHISTHKKLDAMHSRWGSKDIHAELFVEALSWYVKNKLADEIEYADDDDLIDAYFSKLDRKRIYTFVVRPNSRNRVVCNAPDHPTLYFAGEFDDEFILRSENTSKIEQPEHICINDDEDLVKYLLAMDPMRAQGVMIYYGEDTPDFGTIKLTSSAHQRLVDVRCNVPSIRFRYLQVRNDSTSVGMLTALYPDYLSEFQRYEEILATSAEMIFQGYVDRYINHEYVVLPQSLWFIAKDLHDLYLQDTLKNRISRELVINHLNTLTPTRLNWIIRSYLMMTTPLEVPLTPTNAASKQLTTTPKSEVEAN